MNKRLARFLSYYKPYLGLLILDLFCALLVAAISLLMPLFVRYITGDVLEAGLADAWPSIASAGIAMLALVLLQAGCEYFYDYRGHAMGAMMERDMRAELFAHMQRLSFRFYDGERPGALLSRLTNDLHALAELYHHGPEDVILNSVKFIGAMTILLLTNAQLAGVVALFLPLILVFTLIIGKRMYRQMRENLARIGDVNAGVEENLSGIRVVQSFAAEDVEIRKFAVQNDRYLQSRKGIYRSESIFYTGVDTIIRVITVAVVALGGLFLTRAQLDLPDLLAFIMYVNYVTEPVTRLAWAIQQYQEGVAGFHRFADLMDIQPDITDAPGALPLTKPRGDIRYENVSFHYSDGAADVLEDVSLAIAAGERVAIVGHSGVGKTTLCSLLPRFYEATAGRILIDGVDIRGVTLRSLREHIGIVQQEVYLFSGTVMENIRYGCPTATDEAVMQAARRANAHDFILSLPNGYATDIGHRGVKLSGGQRQRLSIARVFLKDPPILILDEATSALDNESEMAVMAALDALSQGRTTLIIAHRLGTIQRASRIVVMDHRGIAETGTHGQLLALGGVYARLYAQEG